MKYLNTYRVQYLPLSAKCSVHSETAFNIKHTFLFFSELPTVFSLGKSRLRENMTRYSHTSWAGR